MKLIAFIFGVIILGAIVWLAWSFLGYFQASTDEIKASIMGVGSVVLVAIISQHLSKKREIESRHFEQKTIAYSHIFDLMFKAIQLSKEDKELSPAQLASESLNIKKSLMVWGSPAVLKAWDQFEVTASAGEVSDEKNPLEILKRVENIFKAIRKDLGHNDTDLKTGDLFRLIVRAEDKNLLS